MDKLNQNVIANYSIVLKGNTAQIKKAVDLLDNVIDDQDCFLEYLDAYRERLGAENRINCAGQKIQRKYVEKRYSWDKYVEDDEDEEEYDYEEDDDYEDDEENYAQVYAHEGNASQIIEERFEVVDTNACVWTEDIFQLANDLA